MGAHRLSDGRWEFLLWAPNVQKASVHLLNGNVSEGEEYLAMEPLSHGYHHAVAANLAPVSTYLYRLDDGRELPDPASRFQPDGVHGPSQIADLGAFPWNDHEWKGHALETSIFYELHVGTHTPEGSFDALIARLPYLASLGVTAIELMPIAQFPGARNWGYDGVYPFAPQNSYGRPETLQKLVNAAHEHGLAMALDVVYNHLGPEGNYLSAYGPYFTYRYRTTWGEAINFDSAGSDEVRRFFLENALHWLEDYHFDALRLDAIHGICDNSATPFLAELKESVSALSKRLGRRIHLIAESDLNDVRVLRDAAHGGYGLDAQWSDDFHHSLHSLLTGENVGYYGDYGGVEPLLTTLNDGWYYSGQYSSFRERRHGNSARGISPAHFVVSSQNHDQIGNRPAGDRLSTLVNFEALKLAAGITLLSPFVPLLFMGEEYGETAPFQYFTSHGNAELAAAVSRGRREEFAAFCADSDIPDPQDVKTFERSRVNFSLSTQGPHSTLLRFYQRLIQIRSQYKLGIPGRQSVQEVEQRGILLLRQLDAGQLAMLFNFGEGPTDVVLPQLAGSWKTVIDSADVRWNGPRADSSTEIILSSSQTIRLCAHSFVVMESSLG